MAFFNLQSGMRWLFLAHALAGTIALLVMAIPLISKKGGRAHVKAGWVYVYAMIFIGVSAMVITPWRGWIDPTRTEARIIFSFFLGYIAVFSLTTVWYGIAALRRKARTAAVSNLELIGPPVFLIALGLAVQLIGWQKGAWLLMLFPFLGHRVAQQEIKYWRTAPTLKRHWWYAHMEGMMIACIATLTAFLVTALPRIFEAGWLKSPALWIAPGLIIGTVSNRWQHYYRVKFKEI